MFTVYVGRGSTHGTAPSRFPAKTTNEAKVYAIDFSAELDSGVSIASVAWTSIPTGLTFSSKSNTSTKAQAIISSGTAGVDYQVSCVVVTDESPTQTFEALPRLKILQGEDS